MPELQFDAVLIDQITPKLQEIADSLRALAELASGASKDIQGAFDDMTLALDGFQKQAITTQDAVETAFVGMAVGANLFTEALTNAAAPMQAFNEQLVLFTDEASANFTGGINADTSALRGFVDANAAATEAVTAEGDLLSGVSEKFAGLAESKIAASAAEAEVASSTALATTGFEAEAVGAGAAAAAINTEANKGKESTPARSTGYGAVLGATMMLGLAGAMARVGINMLQSGIQSENAMNLIIAMADQSQKNFTTYQNGLKSLALETGKTLSDLSAGLYDIVSVGFKGADSLTILAAAAKAAAAGGGELHDVTNGLSSILIGYGLHASDAAAVTNALVIAVRDGKAEFPDFSRAIGLVGNAAKTSGISFQEAASALSVMSLTFPSTRQAGQDLQHLLNELGINAAQVEKRAEGMGHGFNLATFESMSLLDRLQLLETIAGGDTGKMEKLVGGLTSMKAVMAILANNGDSFNATLEHMQSDTNALGDAFNTHSQTIEFQIERIRAAVSVLSNDFAEMAKPVLVAMFNALANAFGGFADLVEHHANIMTPLLAMLAFAITGMLIGAIVALSEILADSMAIAAPIVATFTAIAMALGALIGWFISAYNNSAPLRDALAQLGAAFQQLWMGIKPLVDSVLSVLVGWLQQAAQWLGMTSTKTDAAGKSAQGAQGAIGLLVGIIQGLTAVVKDLANWLAPLDTQFNNVTLTIVHGSERLKGFRDELTASKQPILDQAQQAHNLAGAHKSLMDGLQGVAGGMLGLGSAALFVVPYLILGKTNMINFAMAAYNALGNFLAWLPGIGQVLGAIGNFAVNGLEFLTNLFLGNINIIAGVKEAFSSLGALLTRLATGGAGALVDALSGLVDALIGAGPAIGGFAAAAAPIAAIVLAIAAVVAGVVVAFKHWWDTSAGFRAMIGELGKQLLSLWTFLQSQFQVVWKDLSNTFQTQLVPILQSLQGTWKAIQPALIAIGTVVLAVLIPAFGLIISIIKALIAALAPLIGGIFTALVGAFKFVIGIIQLVITVVGGLISLIVDLIFNQKNLGNDLKNIWQGIKDSLGNIIGGLWGMIQGIFGGAIKAILSFVGTFIGSIIDFFTHLFEKLVGHSVVPDMIKGIIEWFLKLPIEILQMVGQFVVNLITTFLTLAARVLVTIGTFVVRMVVFFETLGRMILASIGAFVEGAVRFFLNLGMRILATVGNFVLRTVVFFETLGRMVLAAIGSFVMGVVNFFISLGVQVLTTVADFVLSVINAWEQLTRLVLAAISAWVSQVLNFFIQLGQSIIDTVINFVMHIVAQFVGLGLRVLAAIDLLRVKGIQVFNNYKDTVIGIVLGFVNGIVQHFNDLKNNLGTAVQNALNFVRDKFNGFINGAIDFGKRLIDQVAQGIKNAIPNLVGAVTSGLGKIRNLFPHSPAKEGPLTTAPYWGGTLMDQVSDGITNNTSKVVTAAKTVAGQIAGHLGNVQATTNVSVAGASLGGTAGGTPLALGRAGAAGTIQHQEIHVHLDGGVGTGLSMINATDRAKIVQDIAVEMARQMRLQGRVGTGYAGG